jgi:hypothetical protein
MLALSSKRHCLYLISQTSGTFSACKSWKSSTIPESSVLFSALNFAFSMVSLLFFLGNTRHLRNTLAMIATCSTCANFLPGQVLIPSDHGRYEPFGGVQIYSVSIPLVLARFLIQRCGFHSSGFLLPQYFGCVCRALRLSMTRVYAGIR